MKYIFLVVLSLFAINSIAQKKIQVKDLNPDQKKEWDQFVEYYSGNGNGTCFPIMEAQIDSGKCTQFSIRVNLAIDKQGKIKKVRLAHSAVLCENKAIQKEVLECFLDTLKDDFTEFKTIKNVVIQNASF